MSVAKMLSDKDLADIREGILRDKPDNPGAVKHVLLAHIAAQAARIAELDTWWQRDSTALGKVIGERNTLRAVVEDQRAQLTAAQGQLEAMREALTDIGEYTGQGLMTTPWQQIVRDMGNTARAALAQAAPKEGL